jgi:cytochrome oxidase assembly protein ShyY1
MAVALLLAAGCASAGVWQWSRHVARSAAVSLIQTNYQADVVPLDQLLGPDDAALPPDAVWRPVAVQGHYLTGDPVLLRNRPVDSQPGFHVLEPFVITEGGLAGSTLVVDRGWVPTGADSSAAESMPQPPTGTVQVVVRLRPDEPRSSRPAPAAQVHAISVEQVRDASAASPWPDLLPTYGMAVTENGAAPVGLGRLPAPSTSLGSHLSYAFQWWVFALGAVVGGVVLLVREGRTGDEADGAQRVPASTRRRRPTAEQEEDALIDAQLHR